MIAVFSDQVWECNVHGSSYCKRMLAGRLKLKAEILRVLRILFSAMTIVVAG